MGSFDEWLSSVCDSVRVGLVEGLLLSFASLLSISTDIAFAPLFPSVLNLMKPSGGTNTTIRNV
jgi:hypothetical protein